MPENDAAIDRLYQLPLDQFTPARNTLAKELKRAAIKELEKPSAAAWAVNQLFWRQRSTYDQLVKSADRLRGEPPNILPGKSSDIRHAEQDHRGAIKDATEKIRAMLQNADQPLSPQTLTAIQETLEALPSPDQPGRLTRPLKPLGFEALSGVSIRPALRIVEQPAGRDVGQKAAPAPDGDEKASRAKARQLARQREKEERERKERQRDAQRALKAAEAAMLRAEDAVKKAEKALAESRAKRDEAVSEYQRARLRAHE
jgi:hypothetical protein